MKQTLVIGSTVVDVFLNIPNLPSRGQDVNITNSEYRIGGCAYNVYKALEFFKSPALLCSPAGFGMFRRMVCEQFRKDNIQPIASLEIENGCCYCLIDPEGERTFLSHHGAEYIFSRSWMKDIDYSQYDTVFICGIDVEEPTGDEIVEFVWEHPDLSLFFAPGPRIKHIPCERIERILCHRDINNKGPLIHLNKDEMNHMSNETTVEQGAEFLAEKTDNSVVITLAEEGCYCLPGPGEKGVFVPGFPATVVDTVGSGDVHCGALIACLKEGMSLVDSCRKANEAGAAVVGIRGALLDNQTLFK